MAMRHQIRGFVLAHDRLPAFQAAYVVLIVLAALLLNLGAFAMLVGAHMLLDLFMLREKRWGWRRKFAAVLRANLLDIMFFLIALTVAVYLYRLRGVVVLDGLWRAQAELLRIAGVAIPKLGILRRFCHSVSELPQEVGKVAVAASPLLGIETFFLLMCTVSILLLAFSPFVLGIDGSALARLYTEQLMPWKL